MWLPPFPTVKRQGRKAKLDKAHWLKLIRHIQAMKSEKEIANLLKTLMPNNHRKMLLKRAIAMQRLSQGFQYRKISDELSLSPQTIAEIKKAYQENFYRGYNDRSKKVRESRIRRLEAEIAGTSKKPLPKRHRRTKYGRVPLP